MTNKAKRFENLYRSEEKIGKKKPCTLRGAGLFRQHFN
jgi:hypothetical protein